MVGRSQEKTIVIAGAARTPFGKFGGALKDYTATDLGVFAAQAAIARAGISPADIDHVIFGNVLQTSADAAYLARQVGLKAKIPVSVSALAVNRLCGSGVHEPGASRDSRRALGNSAGARKIGGLALGGPDG
jgi:acetyl-CoA acetyltransferase